MSYFTPDVIAEDITAEAPWVAGAPSTPTWVPGHLKSSYLAGRAKAHLSHTIRLGNNAFENSHPIIIGHAIACRFQNLASFTASEESPKKLYIYARNIVPWRKLNIAVYTDDVAKSPPEPKNHVGLITDYVVPEVGNPKWYQADLSGYDPDADEYSERTFSDSYYWLAIMIETDLYYYSVPGVSNQWARCNDYWYNGFNDPWDSEEESGTMFADLAMSIYVDISEAELGLARAKSSYAYGLSKASFEKNYAKSSYEIGVAKGQA